MSHRVRVYPHNDLFNLAHYQRGIITEKVASSIEDGLGLDCMSCLISIAFSVEALINFIGHKRVDNWQERQDYRSKMQQVCAAAGIDFNTSNEPFQTLWSLKEMRDSIAHGQPLEISVSVESREELRRQMECPWDQRLNPNFVNRAYEQAKQLERTLFANCNISVGETLTSAVGVGI